MTPLVWAQAQLPVDPLVSPAGELRAVLGMLFVLGLLGTLAWLARRGKLRLPTARSRAAVAVETAVPLGDRRSLVIVSVEGRRLLLGLTPAQVSLVTELATPAPTFDQAVDRHLAPPPPS